MIAAGYEQCSISLTPNVRIVSDRKDAPQADGTVLIVEDHPDSREILSLLLLNCELREVQSRYSHCVVGDTCEGRFHDTHGTLTNMAQRIYLSSIVTFSLNKGFIGNFLMTSDGS